MNHAILIGNIVRIDPLKRLPSGTPVLSVRMATNTTWRNKEGEKKENAQFHDIVLFEELADRVSINFSVGDKIKVEGRVQTRSWEINGDKRSRTEIIGSMFDHVTI